MSTIPVRTLLLVSFVFLLAGCAVPPGVTHDALGLGVALALILRRMVTDGTWPQGVTWKEPYKTLVPSLIGALAGMLTAVLHGASWNDALQAMIAGLPVLVQGALEAALPQKKDEGKKDEDKGKAAEVPNGAEKKDPPAAPEGKA
jgi:hypothetical protein